MLSILEGRMGKHEENEILLSIKTAELAEEVSHFQYFLP